MKVKELKRVIETQGLGDDDDVLVRIIVKPYEFDTDTPDPGDEVTVRGEPVIVMCPVDIDDVLDATHPGALVLMVGLDDSYDAVGPG